MWLIPAFQIEGRELVPGVEAVAPKLSPALHPDAVAALAGAIDEL